VSVSPRTVGRLKRAAIWALVWTIIVLIYSFRLDARGQPVSDWLDGFKIAAAQYYVWAALTPVVFWVDRLLPVSRDAIGRRIFFHIPAFVALAIVYTYANYYVAIALGASYDMSVVAGGFSSVALRAVLRSNVWMYWVLVSLFVAFEHQKHSRERDLQTAQLERLLAQTQLAALRAQLHPHFLFNALNTVSSLVDENPRGARLMLEQIGRLLRLSLEHAHQEEVPLVQELAFIELYLEIQRARYEERLKIVVHLDPKLADMLVPTFILQPLVENAVHHGAATRFENTLIEVSASQVDDRLLLRVCDNGSGLPDEWDPVRDAGIGLSNTRERLRRLYGDHRHQFDIARRAQGGVEVAVNVPLRMAS
jgi:two-component system, LytTR family, sensor kinase